MRLKLTGRSGEPIEGNLVHVESRHLSNPLEQDSLNRARELLFTSAADAGYRPAGCVQEMHTLK